jgi:hypothetical protein
LRHELPEDIAFGARLGISIVGEAIGCAPNKRLTVNQRSTWRVSEDGELTVQ